MRRLAALLLGAALVLACVCVLIAAFSWQQVISPLLRPTTGAAMALPPATPVPVTQATPPSDTARAIAAAEVPLRDSRLLAERLRPGAGEIPAVVNAQPPHSAVGDKATFWISNSDTRETFLVTATLRVISTHIEIWLQDGLVAPQDGLVKAAQAFDNNIYPTVHRYFGSEWNPGVDNNPRVVILNARFTGAAGYYSSHDEYSRQVNPYSNEREMLYMNIDAATPGTDYYLAILSHEFQHMVHWYADPNEDSWVNEGASELAARLCGYGVTGALRSFAQAPGTQLNSWSLAPDEDTLPHYGASYLWLDYFLQREGAAKLQAAISEPANGIAGFSRVLASIPGALDFDSLFADWVVANLVDDPSQDQGRYGYDVTDLQLSPQETFRDLPVRQAGTVNQYGTDYAAIAPPRAPLHIEFTGRPVVPVVPNTPYQGRYQWWSNRGDMSDTTLTRAFDLTHTKKATLQYALWYDLEDGWDYAYVEVSTDGGGHWTPLTTTHTSTYDPNGNAFGPGYTGFSGHPPGATTLLKPQWVQEQVDLSPYAGQNILVRFEMATDDAVNLPGMCLDNIAIPEIGFRDDAESASGGWQAEGFVRIDNQLPQDFLVQVIEQGKEVRVHRLTLDGARHGALTLDSLAPGTERVVIAISGTTPNTTEPAAYNYSITTGPQ